jgi:hypothetical protein
MNYCAASPKLVLSCTHDSASTSKRTHESQDSQREMIILVLRGNKKERRRG